MVDVITNIIKFIAAVLVLPLTYSCVHRFYAHLTVYPSIYADFFKWGLMAYFLTYVFIFRFQDIFVAGQKIILEVFKALSPLDRFLANIIPFYLTFILILFYVTTQLLKVRAFEYYFVFFSGFALAMHILLSAQNSRDQDKSAFKPTYFLMMNIIIIFSLCLVVFGLDAIVGKFTILAFINSVFHDAGKVFKIVYHLIG